MSKHTMKKATSLRLSVVGLPLVLLALLGMAVSAPDKAEAARPGKPIKALMITGGCCHDYEMQRTILSSGTCRTGLVRW